MKIDVVTLQEGRNYGSVLQAFATIEFFAQHGCKVNILNTFRRNRKLWSVFRASLRGNIAKLPVRVLNAVMSAYTAGRMFNRFRAEHLKISGRKSYADTKDLEGYTSDADAFCSGSDQVWNSELTSGLNVMFYLAFVPDSKYKFAFSSSFGKQEISSEEVAQTRKYIDSYRHISVREESGLRILNEQYNYKNAVQVLDPTLCLDGNTWRQYAKSLTGGGGAKL